MKRALITGILGQDGSYMAEFLHSKGYQVFGLVRDNTDQNRIEWIKSLVPGIDIHRVDILDKPQLLSIIKILKPGEIYNFASSTNVFNSWEDLDGVMNLDAKLPQNILEIIVTLDKNIKFFQASSCLVFGRDQMGVQNEVTPRNPIHPYGAAKLYADNIISEARRLFGLYAVSGIFFNHESERRGDNFFTKKIIREAVNIKNGKQQTIKVGNLSAYRDYGCAENFMDAVYSMMQNNEPKDYVIGTGKLISMEQFCRKVFSFLGLRADDHLEVTHELYRHNDTHTLCADATKIKKELGWEPTRSIDQIIEKMIRHELKK